MTTVEGQVRPSLADPDLYHSGDPHAVWRRLRAEDPVSWQEPGEWPGFWSLTRYRDAVRVYRDTASFTSRRGIMLTRRPLQHDPASDRMVIASDGARHAALRAALTEALDGGTVARIRAGLPAFVESVIEAAVRAGRTDFVQAVASPIPLQVICDLLGVPLADRPMIFRLTSTASGADDVEFSTPGQLHTQAQAHAEILSYFRDLVVRRRAEPGNDVVSRLATAELQGRLLTVEEVVLNCDNLIIGGNEPARQAIGGIALCLVEQPELLAALRRDPSVVNEAVEEFLRWTTPVMHLLRTAVADVEIEGRRIRAGDRVVVWNASADRDEDEFPGPDRVRLDRRPNRHLAFGGGDHYCFGASLARLQLRTFLRLFVARVDGLAAAGPPDRLRSNFVNGLKRLPVSLSAARGRS